jgi:nitronate monooxygenase
LAAVKIGYAGVQMGTRFIATPECHSSDAYKAAIVRAKEQDIVLSERITGVPVAVIHTPYIERMGLHAGTLARHMLRGNKSKHIMRMLYTLRSLYQLKHASMDEQGTRNYWQAGKSVEGIGAIESVDQILQRFSNAAAHWSTSPNQTTG